MIDVVPWLREERAAFIALLESLDAEDWARPTECPAWTVHGIALHVLGDDLSLLSRQRDDAPSGLIAYASRSDATAFVALLDGFNEEWVTTASFLSPALTTDLLRMTGDSTADWYAAVQPGRLGEPVPWLGPEPAPYWLIAAREYVERWIHHHQVARATGRRGPDEELTRRAAASIVHALPRLVAALPAHAPDDATITLTVLGTSWTVVGPAGGWTLSDGRPDGEPTVEVVLDEPDAAALALSRGLDAEALREAATVRGNGRLAAAVADTLVRALASGP